MSKHRSKTPNKRQLRVGEELRHALARILMRGELRDPALAGLSITVAEVRASPDLKNATAYVLPLGGADAEEVVVVLSRAAPFLRGQIAREVELRYVPVLSFEVDRSFDQAERIDTLLRAAEPDEAVKNPPGEGT